MIWRRLRGYLLVDDMHDVEEASKNSGDDVHER